MTLTETECSAEGHEWKLITWKSSTQTLNYGQSHTPATCVCRASFSSSTEPRHWDSETWAEWRCECIQCVPQKKKKKRMTMCTGQVQGNYAPPSLSTGVLHESTREKNRWIWFPVQTVQWHRFRTCHFGLRRFNEGTLWLPYHWGLNIGPYYWHAGRVEMNPLFHVDPVSRTGLQYGIVRGHISNFESSTCGTTGFSGLSLIHQIRVTNF